MIRFQQRHILISGLAIGVCSWCIDAAVGVAVGDGTLSRQLFAPTLHEFVHRLLFILFFALFIVFACFIVRRRDQLEAELQAALDDAAKERIRSEAVIAGIGDGISIQDRDLRIIYQNQVHRNLSGGDFVGKYCYSVYDQSDTPCPDCPVAASFRDGSLHTMVKELPPGRPVRHIEIIASPLRDSSGEIIAGIEVVRDISAHKQAEAALAQQAADLRFANRELEAFSYSVSHDLRKPLTIIYTAAQALRDDCSGTSNELAGYYIHSICDASQRMEELIDALQELAQISRSDMMSADVDLTDMVQVIAAELGMIDGDRRVSLEIAPGLTGRGDPRLLRTVLENLLENAWKYTCYCREPFISFGRTQTPRGDAFYVRDNGAGFDPAQAEELFNPFVRLHTEESYPGTGIGLATVRRIVERHGGEVWAEGASGNGATFYFTLPETS